MGRSGAATQAPSCRRNCRTSFSPRVSAPAASASAWSSKASSASADSQRPTPSRSSNPRTSPSPSKSWTYHAKAYLILHEPAGYECSQKPSAWPSIYTLLPAPLRQRPNNGMQPGVLAIGRLDQDTTGLLLLSDDGPFIHKMSSPKHHVPKVYEVGTADPVTVKQVERLLEGVVLDDSSKPVRAAACEMVREEGGGEVRDSAGAESHTLRGGHHLRLTLTEGKYHQVKRMIAAVGNRVETLHRSRIGQLVLPADLLPGQWRWLDAEQLTAASNRGQ
jgi:16S rRNA pseudouridine516 synthase